MFSTYNIRASKKLVGIPNSTTTAIRDFLILFSQSNSVLPVPNICMFSWGNDVSNGLQIDHILGNTSFYDSASMSSTGIIEIPQPNYSSVIAFGLSNAGHTFTLEDA